MGNKSLALALTGLFALLLSALLTEAAQAQTRAIRGKVVDEKGQPLKDVEIRILGMDIKREYKTKTDKKGEYYHGGLPYGRYRVIARKDGYAPDEVAGVQPPAGGEEEINFTLRPGGGRLASEMTPEELEQLKRQQEEAERARRMTAEIKALFDQALDFSAKGQYAEAIAKFKEALEKDPKQPYIWANLGDAYAKNKQYSEAIDAFNKAIEIKPDEAAFHQNLGIVYGNSGKLEEAKQAFKKAAELNPAGAAQNYFNLGAILVNSGKTAEAIPAFEEAIKADPNYAEAYYQLATCLLGLNRIDEAIKHYKKYAEIGKNPANVQTAKELVSYLEGKKK